MAEPNVGQAVATSWENVVGNEPRDVIFNSRAFFYSLGKNGFRVSADGGRVFEFTVEYAGNTNFRSYTEMEELDTTRINVFDALRYTPKIAAGTIVISDLEAAQAQGKSAKINLIKEKVANGKDSHIDNLNTMMLGSSGSGSDWHGIQFLISITPTTGTVGGVSRATFAFHRNRQASGAQSAASFDNLRSSLTSIYNQCSLGGVKRVPRYVQTDRTVFEGYEQLLVAIEKIAEARMKVDADIAFDNAFLQFKGAKMFYDESAAAGEARLYQNEDLKAVYLKGHWMKMHPPDGPHNQLAAVYKVDTFGQLCLWGSRHTGVVSAIT